jgi:hypothetical protein
MHQSPEKKLAKRRDKYVEIDLLDTDGEADRRLHRASQPKARRFALRDEAGRDLRYDKGHWDK